MVMIHDRSDTIFTQNFMEICVTTQNYKQQSQYSPYITE